MRFALPALAVILLWPLAALTAETPYRAGFMEMEVAGNPAFPVGIWYPTRADETTWTTGPYALDAARDAAPAPSRFPLIVLSHGSGADQFHHRDWTAYLARHGFVVAAIKHAGDSLNDVGGRGSDIQLTGRPWQVRETLDAVLSDPRLTNTIDPNRIGMIGYSAGGYTTLTTIGGRPKYALWGEHCKEHPEDDELCPKDGSWVPPRITRPGWELPPPDPRIKAAVVMAPAGILFDAEGLAGIDIPLRIYRASDDHFVRNVWNADHVASLLTNDPQVRTVPGDHFVFIAPCPAELAERFPESCTDAPGVDRAAIHAGIEAELVSFFDSALPPEAAGAAGVTPSP